MAFLETLKEKIGGSSLKNPTPGLYHYQLEKENEKSRAHLRIEGDGNATLIINANRVMHLNPTAALLAHFIMEQIPDEAIIRMMTKQFNVRPAQARADFEEFQWQIKELLRPDGACAIHEMDLETMMPFSARPAAPYRMDMALTYRCNNDCAHCYNARERDFPELKTEQWFAIIDKCFDLGVPHIVFTGGEATLRDDLPELIAYAESKGQITGLNTNARRLIDERFLQKLLDAGLDHIQITVESHDPLVHDLMMRAKGAFKQTIQGLKNALNTNLYVMTNTTMLRSNVHTMPETLDFLGELGVPTIGMNALIYSGHGLTVGTGLRESELQPILEMAVEKTSARGQRLIWYTPTQYCRFDPTQLNLGVKGCTASLYSMCVESNGNVLPCQSYYHPIGNILTDSWDSIWNHELSIRLRERRGLPDMCSDCSIVAECGGGCPLRFESHRKQYEVNDEIIPLPLVS
ncbi:MAG: radical SAM protein [Anaerolineales bacterium]|nr:radical SAM protein [Anaerolineales bacterium]